MNISTELIYDCSDTNQVNVSICFVFTSTLPFAWGDIDEQSISVDTQVTPNYVTFDEYIVISPNLQKMLFTIDFPDCEDIDYQDEFDFEAVFSSDILTDFELDYHYEHELITKCDFDIVHDCGDGDGSISIDLEQTSAILSTIGFDGVTTNFLGTASNLTAGSYTLDFLDMICSYTIVLEVLDGSFTIDVTTIEPLLNCVNSVSDEDASGVIPATVEGLFVGGSGEFDIEISLPGAIYSVDEFDFVISGIESAGTFGLNATDLDTGCEAVDVVIVTDDDLVFETTDVDVVEMITNGLGEYYDTGVITVSTTLDALDLTYDWQPGFGTNEGNGVLSDIQTSTIYTVVINVEDTTCELELEVDMPMACVVPQDLNGDGIINTSDISIFTSQFGADCGVINCTADFNGDNLVNGSDTSILLLVFGCTVQEVCSGTCHQ